MDNLLKNRSILITGGNRGIGRAVSEYLLNRGSKVAIQFHKNRYKAEELLGKHQDSMLLFQADLSDLLEIPKFFREVADKMGRIDVIVNNAGIAVNNGIQVADEPWIDSWLKTMDVNLNAVGLLCKKAIQYFLENKISGKIINISSRAAFRGDTPDYLAYAASKGGVVSLTRSIARAFGKQGIVAFTVAPGFVQTDMAQKFFNEYGKDYALKDIALEELTTPEDIAPLIAFLASGLADHATGGTFDINAGSYVH